MFGSACKNLPRRGRLENRKRVSEKLSLGPKSAATTAVPIRGAAFGLARPVVSAGCVSRLGIVLLRRAAGPRIAPSVSRRSRV